MAHDPDSARRADAVIDRNGSADGVQSDAETAAELHARVRRLEEQLAALKPSTALAPYAPPPATAPDGFAAWGPAAAGALLPAVKRFTAAATGFWGRFGFLAELRLMVKMYVDGRYRQSRVAQFGVPACLILMTLNYFLWPSWYIVGPVGERLVLVVLAVALYKILSREAGRYADVLDYLSRYGRGQS